MRKTIPDLYIEWLNDTRAVVRRRTGREIFDLSDFHHLKYAGDFLKDAPSPAEMAKRIIQRENLKVIKPGYRVIPLSNAASDLLDEIQARIDTEDERPGDRTKFKKLFRHGYDIQKFEENGLEKKAVKKDRGKGSSLHQRNNGKK